MASKIYETSRYEDVHFREVAPENIDPRYGSGRGFDFGWHYNILFRVFQIAKAKFIYKLSSHYLQILGLNNRIDYTKRFQILTVR